MPKSQKYGGTNKWVCKKTWFRINKNSNYFWSDMEDLFWKFYCCKWKLTLCCFHVDSQKPLDTMHRGDVEEEMAASSLRSQSLVSQTVRTNSSAIGKLHSNPSCLTQKGDSNRGLFPLWGERSSPWDWDCFFFFSWNTFACSKCVCRCLFGSKFPSLLLIMSDKEHDFCVCVEWMSLISGKFKKANKPGFRLKQYFSLLLFYFFLYCSDLYLQK